jgi:hypothetical protein
LCRFLEVGPRAPDWLATRKDYVMFRFLRLLYVFGRETQAFTREASAALGVSDSERAVFMRRCYRGILRAVALTIVVGSVVVPAVAPWVAMPLFKFTPKDAAGRMVMGLAASLPLALLYVFAGVGVGCLLAPREFMASPAGTVWLKLIGARSVGGARVACAFLALGGIAGMIVVIVLELAMAPLRWK